MSGKTIRQKTQKKALPVWSASCELADFPFVIYLHCHCRRRWYGAEEAETATSWDVPRYQAASITPMPFGDGVHPTFTFPDNSVSSITFPSRATGARHGNANLGDSRAAFPPRILMTFVTSVGWSLVEWEDEENEHCLFGALLRSAKVMETNIKQTMQTESDPATKRHLVQSQKENQCGNMINLTASIDIVLISWIVNWLSYSYSSTKDASAVFFLLNSLV